MSIPIIGDGDTGCGNAVNVKRTVVGYAGAGFAAVMIEDQNLPKRCGFARGVEVVDRAEAVARLRTAVDARDEGADILIPGRTDAATTMRAGRHPDRIVSWPHLDRIAGLDDYCAGEECYRASGPDDEARSES